MSKNSNLTTEQKVFLKCMLRLKELYEAEERDMEAINGIRFLLWEKVKLFARSEMTRMLGEYSTKEELLDVEQDMALIFFEKLPYYNPLMSTPTTYFVRYFREKITNYIRENKVHMTQYDSNNIRKINSAIEYYKNQGLSYTMDMLSTKTGLSQRVIQNTLKHSQNAKRASIEEAFDLHANTPTPEEIFVQMENQQILYDALIRNTTKEELNLIIMRVNAEGSKEMPYDQMSKITGLPIRTVKACINRAICKLNLDQALKNQFNNHNTYKPHVQPIAMQDRSAEIIRKHFDDFLS